MRMYKIEVVYACIQPPLIFIHERWRSANERADQSRSDGKARSAVTRASMANTL